MKKVLSVVIILAIIIFLSYVGTLPSDEKAGNNDSNQTVKTEKVNEETNDVEKVVLQESDSKIPVIDESVDPIYMTGTFISWDQSEK